MPRPSGLDTDRWVQKYGEGIYARIPGIWADMPMVKQDGNEPWASEPDLGLYDRPLTSLGLPRYVIRSSMGNLNGYVITASPLPVDPETGEGELYCPHGGVTFQGEVGKMVNYADDNLMRLREWLKQFKKDKDAMCYGFDCAHLNDLVPAVSAFKGLAGLKGGLGGEDRYRDFGYVMHETKLFEVSILELYPEMARFTSVMAVETEMITMETDVDLI